MDDVMDNDFPIDFAGDPDNGGGGDFEFGMLLVCLIFALTAALLTGGL